MSGNLLVMTSHIRTPKLNTSIFVVCCGLLLIIATVASDSGALYIAAPGACVKALRAILADPKSDSLALHLLVPLDSNKTLALLTSRCIISSG